ncbi:hypothetical protein NLJ89_g9468 [Agrocybe chaxingu]|uniref:Uncharacterized protein n=1 Tax=Agrocybe chaxingu TaxID=84603 RepID=A0A9W8JT83_9AGAR|nr:hypothetical protein NLJ89_g9468 [Agrocybe chaxingu]
MTTDFTRPTRWILLDRELEYRGVWSYVTGRFDRTGNFGPPFRGTLNSAEDAGAGILLTFNGTNAFVMGTLPAVDVAASWDCIIDGRNLGAPDPSRLTYSANNQRLCSFDGLPEGEHRLDVNITTQGREFYFDKVGYGTNITAASLALAPRAEREFLQVDFTDPTVKFDRSLSWIQTTFNREDSSFMSSDEPGISISFSFNGTSAVWYTDILPSLPSSSGTYQFDNDAPVSFTIPRVDIPTFNVRLFSTPVRVDSLPRTLNVTYTGARGESPLSLKYIEVNDQTESIGFLVDLGGSKSKVGPIVGGVLGGLAFLLRLEQSGTVIQTYEVRACIWIPRKNRLDEKIKKLAVTVVSRA